MNNVNFGREGEELATVFLKAHGYCIVQRNYSLNFGEIDIVARDGDTLCFIEVKTRETDDYGHPFEAVTKSKQSTIRKVAQMYLLENDITEEYVRFDVVGIQFEEGNDPMIELLKDAF